MDLKSLFVLYCWVTASAVVNLFWTLILVEHIQQITAATGLLAKAFISHLFSSTLLSATTCSSRGGKL